MIEQGIHQLGYSPVLQEQALRIGIASSAYDRALKRINQMIMKGKRLPILYEKKGRILQNAGKHNDAIQIFTRALAELDKLPLGRRNTIAMVTLRQELKEYLK